MSKSDIVILSAGAITAVGLSLAETAAAARARTAGLREIDWRDRRFDHFVAGAVLDDGLPKLHEELVRQGLAGRQARMLRMAHVALAEALAPLPETTAPIALLLALPEHHNLQPIEAKSFLKNLQLQSGAALELKSSLAAPRGRAAGLMAMRQAMMRLESGAAEFVLVGGVENLIDMHVLGTLDLQGRLRNSGNPDGFIPGEAAGFLLLSTVAKARQLGQGALARVLGCASGKEPGHIYADEPYLGEGLAAAFTSLFDETPPAEPVGTVYASFNGERYWGKEFGVARLRNSAHFTETMQMEHPAECFGDIGAAHGVVMAALAAQALADSYRRGPALVYASSDYGDRAAVLLDAAAST